MDSKARTRAAALPVIEPDRCTGCGWCVAACPDHLLFLEVRAHRKAAELGNRERCTGCAKCIPACNFGAIRMVREGAGARAARDRQPA